MTDLVKNMEIWEQVCITDKDTTKPIEGKGFAGTSINPTSIYNKLTGLFGPCGIGWGYRVLEENYANGHGVEGTDNVTILHVVRLAFWYKWEGERSEDIEAFGQTYFVRKVSSGWTTDEEAPKKSLTDALTKAASMIGVSADIYSGKWDGCKYQGGDKDTPKNDKPVCPRCSAQTIFEDKKKKGELYCWKAKGGCGARYDSLAALEQMAGALKPNTVSDGQATGAGGLQSQDDIPIGPVPGVKTATEAQIRMIQAKKTGMKWTDEDLHNLLEGSFGYKSVKDVPQSKVSEVLKYINND